VRGTRPSRRAGVGHARVPFPSSVGSAAGAAQTSHADLRLVRKSEPRRARVSRTAPRMVTPSPTPGTWRERPLGARGTRPSRRAGVGHATVPFPSSGGSAVGAVRRNREDLRLVMKMVPRRACVSGPDSAPDGDTLTHTGNRGVNDPWGRAGRAGCGELGRSRRGSLPISIGSAVGAVRRNREDLRLVMKMVLRRARISGRTGPGW
jgi:hypothetical protein